MRIDVHMHCAERSKCSHIGEEEIIREAIASGLDSIVITDHHRFVPDDRLIELRKAYPGLQIYSGIEITTPQRGSYDGEDLLLLGVHDMILEQRPDWTYEELYDLTHARNGYIHLCHPMRYHDAITIDITRKKPDAVEIASTNIGRDDREAIRAYARENGLRLMHASDGHYPNHIGMFHVITEDDFHSEAELITCLKSGRYRLSEFPEKVEAFNRVVAAREEIARRIIAQGGDGEEFERETGLWRGYFDRVARGKTYMV